MKRIIFVSIILIVAMFALTISASADSWADKITGGGQLATGTSAVLNITVSAKSDGAGGSTGQMQYSRYNGTLDMHGPVECTWLSDDGMYAVAAGPAKAQYDPNNLVDKRGPWMVVMIKEGGVGSGDKVRIVLRTEEVARSFCTNGYTVGDGGVLVDGNFNIRSK